MPSWDIPAGEDGRWTRRIAVVLSLAAVGLLAVALAVGVTKAQAGRSENIAAIRLVFPASTENAAIRVARCETGGTFYARAVSRTGDYGLFQANYAAHHWRGESTAEFARRHFNVLYHVRWAYRLSRGGTNWGPWTCKP